MQCHSKTKMRSLSDVMSETMYPNLSNDRVFGRRVTDLNIVEVVQEHADRIVIFEKKQDSHDLLLSELAAKSDEFNASLIQQNVALDKIDNKLGDISNKMPNHEEIMEYLQYGRKVKSVGEAIGLGKQVLVVINDVINLLWKPVFLIILLGGGVFAYIRQVDLNGWLTSWLK